MVAEALVTCLSPVTKAELMGDSKRPPGTEGEKSQGSPWTGLPGTMGTGVGMAIAE